MDWIHCNFCFTIPTSSADLFYLTSCGRLLCHICIERERVFDQHQINCQGCRYMQINSQLNPQMQDFFRNPQDLVMNYMRKLKSVIEFQQNHRARLQTHLQTKYRQAMERSLNASRESGNGSRRTSDSSMMRAPSNVSSFNVSAASPHVISAVSPRPYSADVSGSSTFITTTTQRKIKSTENSTTRSFPASKNSSSASSTRLIPLDSPRVFADHPEKRGITCLSKSFPSKAPSQTQSITPIPYKASQRSFKPTILASYRQMNLSSARSSLSTSSSSTVASASKSLMSGRITKGSVISRVNK